MVSCRGFVSTRFVVSVCLACFGHSIVLHDPYFCIHCKECKHTGCCSLQADSGAHGDVAVGPGRVVALVVTLGGMLVFALLIGIVADEISQQVDELRKGVFALLHFRHISRTPLRPGHRTARPTSLCPDHSVHEPCSEPSRSRSSPHACP